VSIGLHKPGRSKENSTQKVPSQVFGFFCAFFFRFCPKKYFNMLK
jgi:hypothetical protein